MRFFCLTLLGIATGVFGTEELCRFIANKGCSIYSIVDRPFPRNEEELQNDCSNLTAIKECITEGIRNCSEGNIDDEYINKEYLQNMTEDVLQELIREIKDDEMFLDVVAEICQVDSKLHTSIVPDISCYKDIIDKTRGNEFCRNYITNALDFLQDLTAKMTGEIHDKFNYHYYSLMNLFEINCILNLINKNCSPLAKDTALEVIQKSYSFQKMCPAQLFPEILELLEDFESARNEEIYVKKLIGAD